MQLYFSGFLVGGLLICALVIILALRFLVHKRARVDPMVTAAPFALIFSIFYVIAYGANLAFGILYKLSGVAKIYGRFVR